jgi:hypothetical protein
MSKICILITLTLLSVSLCRKPLQFLADGEHDELSQFLKAIIHGLQVFSDIPCPAGCDINEDQSEQLIRDVMEIWDAIEALYDGDDLGEILPKLKEKVLDLYNIYSEVYPLCKDAVPAVNQRVHEILAHVSSLEYVVKFTFRSLLNYEKYYDNFVNMLQTCSDEGNPDAPRLCGESFGALVHEIFLWDIKH